VTGQATKAPIRIVVADDSPTARALLVALCESDPGITVVGEATDGQQAIHLTQRLRPALVLMDVHMPGIDGIEATKTIMRQCPTPIIMVTAGTTSNDVEPGLSAIRFGALQVLPKPVGPGLDGHRQAADRLTSMVKALAEVKVVQRRGRIAAVGDTRPSAPRGIVAVAASTGGPPALCAFLQHLPRDLPVPVVVVQHLVAGFLPGLVTWLRAEVPFHVVQAEENQLLEPGSVYLASDARHLEVTARLRASYRDGPAVDGFRPSASVLFSSIARNLGPSGMAVVLTGMGQDGLAGARELHRAGGRILAQDEDTCAVYGMPRVVAEAGIVDRVGPVQELAALVAHDLRSS